MTDLPLLTSGELGLQMVNLFTRSDYLASFQVVVAWNDATLNYYT